MDPTSDSIAVEYIVRVRDLVCFLKWLLFFMSKLDFATKTEPRRTF